MLGEGEKRVLRILRIGAHVELCIELEQVSKRFRSDLRSGQ